MTFAGSRHSRNKLETMFRDFHCFYFNFIDIIIMMIRYQFAGNLQRDGMYGPLVVKHCNDPHRQSQYDLDLPSHTIIVGDWTHFASDIYFPGYYLNVSMTPPKPHSYLINGRGSYQVFLKSVFCIW